MFTHTHHRVRFHIYYHCHGIRWKWVADVVVASDSRWQWRIGDRALQYTWGIDGNFSRTLACCLEYWTFSRDSNRITKLDYIRCPLCARCSVHWWLGSLVSNHRWWFCTPTAPSHIVLFIFHIILYYYPSTTTTTTFSAHIKKYYYIMQYWKSFTKRFSLFMHPNTGCEVCVCVVDEVVLSSHRPEPSLISHKSMAPFTVWSPFQKRHTHTKCGKMQFNLYKPFPFIRRCTFNHHPNPKHFDKVDNVQQQASKRTTYNNTKMLLPLCTLRARSPPAMTRLSVRPQKNNDDDVHTP